MVGHAASIVAVKHGNVESLEVIVVDLVQEDHGVTRATCSRSRRRGGFGQARERLYARQAHSVHSVRVLLVRPLTPALSFADETGPGEVYADLALLCVERLEVADRVLVRSSS